MDANNLALALISTLEESSSDSSDDNNLLLLLNTLASTQKKKIKLKPRVQNYMAIINMYTDADFKSHFRYK